MGGILRVGVVGDGDNRMSGLRVILWCKAHASKLDGGGCVWRQTYPYTFEDCDVYTLRLVEEDT